LEYGLNKKYPLQTDVISIVENGNKIRTIKLIGSAKIVKKFTAGEPKFTFEDFTVRFMSNFWAKSVHSYSGTDLFTDLSKEKNFDKMIMQLFWMSLLGVFVVMMTLYMCRFMAAKKRTTKSVNLSTRRGLFCKHNDETMSIEDDEETTNGSSDCKFYLVSNLF
jgi:ABC-type phosphate/phosphonate transport system permease subunit